MTVSSWIRSQSSTTSKGRFWQDTKQHWRITVGDPAVVLCTPAAAEPQKQRQSSICSGEGAKTGRAAKMRLGIYKRRKLDCGIRCRLTRRMACTWSLGVFGNWIDILCSLYWGSNSEKRFIDNEQSNRTNENNVLVLSAGAESLRPVRCPV